MLHDNAGDGEPAAGLVPPPRSLLVRQTIIVEVTPTELHDLIEGLNAKAVRAADCPEQVDFADYLFRRVAELREATR